MAHVQCRTQDGACAVQDTRWSMRNAMIRQFTYICATISGTAASGHLAAWGHHPGSQGTYVSTRP
jgi:hypothetical protein